MQGLTSEVKQFVLDQGMDLVGIASTDKLDELTPKGYHRPKDLLAECNTSIVMALRWSDTLIDGLPEIRAMYSRMMIMMNNQLDQALLRIVRIADFHIWAVTATPFAADYASMPVRWDQIFPNGNQSPKGLGRQKSFPKAILITNSLSEKNRPSQII